RLVDAYPPVAHDRDARLGPDAGSADPTDNRRQYDWKSHYPAEARSQINYEALYLVAVFIIAAAGILLGWANVIANLVGLSGDSGDILRKYIIYSGSGLLGGAVYGIKYLYRVVARGYWHEDRRLWRLLSPLNASALGFVMGAA